MSNKPDILEKVADYYASKLSEYGETPRGVDWNGEESQQLRFEQLCKVIGQQSGFSLNDLGCGYGALLSYLGSCYDNFTYNGYDVSADMVDAAKNRYPNSNNANFSVKAKPEFTANYGIASGIFNIKLDHSNNEWQDYIEDTIDILNTTSQKGFAFNCLTSYSDAEKMRDHLYYVDPCTLFDLCKRRYSRDVALLHDYSLYEFTILVRKEL